VVVYGLLATAYDKFYSELGLTPADVGTQYGKTLGGAAALTIVVGLGMGLAAWAFSAALLSEPFHGHKAQLAAFAIAVVLELVIVALAWSFFGVLMSLVLLAAFVLLDIGLRWGDPNQKWKTQVFAAAAAICVTWALLSVALDLLADAQADQVKRGGWVGPPQSGDLVFFSVRAMPTELEAATESAKDVAFVAERNDHKLLYLGASGGLLVIYDATAQEALFLPATQFRSPMLNCETAQLAYDERCWKYSKIGPGE
jgi:MFS family permease